ncbi:O-acetyl-ADP-ribose deacetylase [Shewanella corallii]|uniref:O-acetyl-ADP-ribose deacetylase n=1 Tax=Shewanella corallii TaxID=560080 RepID=A0ABT0N670_9GAMM|nr:O-acetyl-ADP-ribose deacetylase [Shewanella corallii]MCL2913941.1 O-acetyl-ADP-ribose deacetylase [Shewanella corallii]
MDIEAIKGDITTLKVDAIVNAANSRLLGGGGVDGAIHRAAGPELLEACRTIGGCPTGEVRVTPGFMLPVSYLFHAVGPVWRGGESGEPDLLASCYIQALAEAQRLNIKSIAFPCISTGVYGFPKKLAAEIAVSVVRKKLSSNTSLKQLIFVCFEDEDLRLYRALLQ